MQRTFLRLTAVSLIVCCNFFLFSSTTFPFSVSSDVFPECFGVSLVGGVDARFGSNLSSVVLVPFLEVGVMFVLCSFWGGSQFIMCGLFSLACVILV